MDIIETVAEQDKLISRNSIRYLNQLTNLRHIKAPTIKSLYRTKCRLMELRQQIFLPKKARTRRCDRCFMDYSEGAPIHEVRPVKLTRFAKLVMKKVAVQRTLTSYQRLYYKKIKQKFPKGTQPQNKLVTTCSFCKKETEVWMNKPLVKRKVQEQPKKKKKKKPKKDVFCGLNKTAVIQSSQKQTDDVICLDDSVQIVSVEQLAPDNSNKSMISDRGFQTTNFMPLNAPGRAKKKIKFSKKKEVITPVKKFKKSKENKKQMKNLSRILTNAKQAKNGTGSKLKAFLKSI